MYDTDGNTIQAHGLGILDHSGVYYIYGESYKVASSAAASHSPDHVPALH